ncbi:hypothetical protein AB3M75_07460 [Serratia ureilytica]|uniref:hypothetical protein n=1 Tax=Serratia ureilytica TaxID=300181 RepID=UPI003723185A
MKIIVAIAAACVLVVSGCASHKTKYFTVNCANKTIQTPSESYNQNDLSLIKKRVSYICAGSVGLIALHPTDLNALK